MRLCTKCGNFIHSAHLFCRFCGLAAAALFAESDTAVPENEEAEHILKQITETAKALKDLQLKYQSMLEAENAPTAADNEKQKLLTEELELKARLTDIRIELSGFKQAEQA